MPRMWMKVRTAARRFENKWLRYTVTLLSLSVVGAVTNNGTAQLCFWAALGCAGFLLTLYFVNIARKAGTRAIEWLLAAVLFVAAAAVLCTTPGVDFWRFVLTPFIAGWLACGLAVGIVRAEIFGWSSTAMRLLHVVVAWAGIAGLALFPAALFRVMFVRMIGDDYLALSRALVVASGPAILIDLGVGMAAGIQSWRKVAALLKSAAESD